ncbi:MAG: phytanoyl-CoA dioxygenase family protein [Caulobacteraceae bacterium]
MTYSVDRDGFSLVEGLLNEAEVEPLLCVAEQDLASWDRRGGVRNLLDHSGMRELAESPTIRKIVESVLGPDAQVVRGILFDKTEEANWKVPWHQDVTIAVDRRIEAEGFGPWSVKAGVLHVQPPASVLQQMISVRLHLDDCPAENGVLRVIAGSHRNGRLSERFIQEMAETSPSVVCAMRRGGALIMRPLLLHTSSASSVPGHRRVLHFDYAAAELPAGMNWAAAQA